jgi:hypothetical protein
MYKQKAGRHKTCGWIRKKMKTISLLSSVKKGIIWGIIKAERKKCRMQAGGELS